MNKTNIEWCSHTWNPITGCKRGCKYCYAKRINDRFNKTPFSEIIFHEERLNDPIKEKKSCTIFVGSMSDVEYWSVEQLTKILDICEKAYWHTFMFLSKNPKSYIGIHWPKNTMQGLTLEKVETMNDNYKITILVGNTSRPFLSIEPISGYVTYNHSYKVMEKIIIGAMTGRGATEPKREWIESVDDNVPEDKVFWKTNIKKYMHGQ